MNEQIGLDTINSVLEKFRIRILRQNDRFEIHTLSSEWKLYDSSASFDIALMRSLVLIKEQDFGYFRERLLKEVDEFIYEVWLNKS